MENVIFSLPYIVKKVINFSIVVLTGNNEEKNNKILESFDEFIKLDGDIHILDTNSSNDFLKIIGDSSIEINEKFCKDETNIIDNTDIYYDYNCDINFINSIVKNDMVLIIDSIYDVNSFNISEIENYINNGYNRINIDFENSHIYQPICNFYNKTKYTWVNEKLCNNEEINNCKLPDDILKINIPDSEYHKRVLNQLSVNCHFNYESLEITRLFGIELYKNELYESCYSELNRYLSIEDNSIKRSEIMTYIGDYYNKTNKDKECIDSYNNAYFECPKIRLSFYKMAYLFYLKKEWEKCILYLEGCLTIPKIDEIEDTKENNFMYEDGPYSMLYVAYWWLGNTEKSKYCFSKALEFNKHNQIYLGETKYYYDYEGNNIPGSLSFKEIQLLYTKSKKVNSILEIYPESARSTHALLKGCSGLVTVITKEQDRFFIDSVENPGNLRILNMSTGEAIKEIENEKFDMIFIGGKYEEVINDYSQYWGLLVWEKMATKLICGSGYINSKDVVDKNLEISGVEENIWYKEISSFEKTIIYKKKKI